MTLEAGRVLDAQVAKKIMNVVACDNWHHCHTDVMEMNIPTCSHNCIPRDHWPPKYSTEIRLTWHVVEKLLSLGWHVDIEDGWHVVVFGGPTGKCESAAADTAPLAICLAALEALG